MSEWVRRWWITYRWRPEAGQGKRVNSVVDTTAQLRAVVEWARAHPDVEAYQYEPRWHLDGEPPDRCRRGHSLRGGRSYWVATSWVGCPCGGHTRLQCRTEGCGDVQLDPAPGPDCAPGG